MTNFETYCAALKDRLNNYKAENKLTYFDRYEVEVETGGRYFRVYSKEVNDKTQRSHRNILSFVDKATGEIFKPASYKAPAKHARGNVNSPKFGMEAHSNSGHVI